MKKFTMFLTLAAFLLATIQAMAQGIVHEPNKPTVCLSDNYHIEDQIKAGERALLSEDFGSGVPPAGWSVIGEGADNWQSSSSNYAGGKAPEATMSWNPQFLGASRFVSPEISTGGMTELFLEFKHMLNDYSGDYTIKVETTGDGVNWNTVWSQSINGSIEAETITLLIDNADVGSGVFQFAFTFDGDSYNINNWYIDDVELREALTNDAGVTVLSAPELAENGQTLNVGTTVKNFGTETISFDVSFEVLDGGSSVYSETQTVSSLPSTESQELTFSGWTTVLGTFELKVETMLSGDENSANDLLTQNIQVIDNVVSKKPIFEEFTSSTCAPCAVANPIIEGVLEDNPGEYSLIKYQMDWPGAGDPYYIEVSGDRSDYYGVAAVPDLYANADQIDPPSSFSQDIFDEYASHITGMDINITADISNDYIISVDATINSYADYPSGMKAHIAVVEKTTYGNTGTNGEEVFNNVIMAMLPGSGGTELGALSSGDSEIVSETYNMSQTFMEQANDLAVVVFVQDDTDQSVIQSEMVDVTSSFVTYNVTFNAEDSEGNAVEDAEVAFDINGFQYTDASGQTIFEEILPGTFDYEVKKSGLMPATGTVEVIDDDVVVDVVMDIPDYFFFEDFEDGYPLDWTMYFSSGNTNNLYWYDGFMVFWKQGAGDEDIMLITPPINLNQAGTLFFEAGDIYSTPSIQVGTVDSPSNPDSFTELAIFELAEPMTEYMLELQDMSPFEDEYLVFKYAGPSGGYFYFDNVKISLADDALGIPQNLNAEVNGSNVDLSWEAPATDGLLGYNIYRDDENIGYVTNTVHTDTWLETGLYDYYVTAVYDEGESVASNEVTANVGDVLVFCEAAGGCSQHISGVFLEDISNESGCNYYSDYTDQVTRLESGQSYTLTVNISTVSNGNDISAWIDYNQDGIFQESENLDCIIDDGSTTFEIDVNVPEDALSGPARMRVRVKYWETDCEGCGYTTWGETEDYTVLIDEYVGIDKPDEASLRIYPNPVKDMLRIEADSHIEKIEIYDYSGQMVGGTNISNSSCNVNMSKYPAGIYLFRISKEDEAIMRKVIIK